MHVNRLLQLQQHLDHHATNQLYQWRADKWMVPSDQTARSQLIKKPSRITVAELQMAKYEGDAIGWFCSTEEAIQQGFFLVPLISTKAKSGFVPMYNSKIGSQAAADFFGLTTEHFIQLFSAYATGMNSSTAALTPSSIASKIKELTARIVRIEA